MSQLPKNPYAPRGSEPPAGGGAPPRGNSGYEAWEQPEFREPSMSVTAILSLVFSVLCITAPLGVVFGIAALVLIAGSGGRKYGKGLAIAGLVIGLLFSTVIIGALVGAQKVAGLVQGEMVKPAASLMASVEAQDLSKVQGRFTPALAASITPEQVKAFKDAYTVELGAFQKMPEGIMELLRSYGELWAVFEKSQRQFNFDGSRDQIAGVPLPATFANGAALVIVFMDVKSRESPSGAVITNIAVLTTTGNAYYLLQPTAENATRGAHLPTPADAPQLPAPAPAPQDPAPTAPPAPPPAPAPGG